MFYTDQPFPNPVIPTPDGLAAWPGPAIGKTPAGCAGVRVIVTRGPGTIGPDPRKIDTQVIIVAEEYQPFPAELYAHGLHAVVFPTPLDTEHPANRVRSLGRPHTPMAKRYALASGCLAGITRRLVLDWYGGPEGFVAKDMANLTTEFETSMATAKQTLQNEWGDKFDQNMSLAQSAMKVVGQRDESLKDLLETPFIVGKGRLGDDPRMIRLFQRIGAGLREDELKDGRAGGSASFESKMSPAEAQAEIRRLQGDPEFTKKWQTASHPAHGDAVLQMQRLYEQAHPVAA
jgi:hypothetical protein